MYDNPSRCKRKELDKIQHSYFFSFKKNLTPPNKYEKTSSTKYVLNEITTKKTPLLDFIKRENIPQFILVWSIILMLKLDEDSEGRQNMLAQNMPFWLKDYFELKTFEKQQI